MPRPAVVRAEFDTYSRDRALVATGTAGHAMVPAAGTVASSERLRTAPDAGRHRPRLATCR